MATDPEYRARKLIQTREAATRKRARDPLAYLKAQRLNTYGLTEEEYETLLADSDGTCDICGGVNANGRQLSLDHDHKTGKPRGFLCHRCNSAIGLLGDDADLLATAAQYIAGRMPLWRV